jgi:hypothetical protein
MRVISSPSNRLFCPPERNNTGPAIVTLRPLVAMNRGSFDDNVPSRARRKAATAMVVGLTVVLVYA